MSVSVVLPDFPTVFQLKGVRIDYGLTPKRALELERFTGNSTDIALWQEEEMGLWNGGKTGVLEDANLPIFWDRKSFNASKGRKKQYVSDIGFAWPVEIASLALPENEPERIGNFLYEMGIWKMVTLRQSNDELWHYNDHFRLFGLVLNPSYFRFRLNTAGDVWFDYDALAGAPQVV